MLSALAIAPSGARAAILRVQKGSASGTHDGTTWARAYRTVQAGLNAAAAGDELWVAEGVWAESVVLKDGVAVYGGFAGAEATRAGRAPATHKTNLTDTVRVPAGCGLATILDGFTVRNSSTGGIRCTDASPTISNNVITNNQTTASEGGGGILVTGASYPVISDNTISDNSASFYGGGISVDSKVTAGKRVIIINNVISSNESTGAQGLGGGVSIFGADVQMTGNTVTGNTADLNGGGVWAAYGAPTISDNDFIENTAHEGGGAYLQLAIGAMSGNRFTRNTATNGAGAYVFGNNSAGTPRRDPSLTANVFSNNTATGGGGGLYARSTWALIASSLFTGNHAVDGGALLFTDLAGSNVFNNTIAGNTATNGGGIAIVEPFSNPILTNNIVTGNSSGIYVAAGNSGSPTLRANDVFSNSANYVGLPDPTGGNGNVSVDPLFVNASGGDYRLKPASPARDAGADDVIPGGALDLDGNARIQGAHVDMGAYELPVSNLYGWPDVQRALKIAGGLIAGDATDATRLNVNGGDAAITIGDAVSIARKVTGKSPNP
jgi:parallel beta-helix repeat protein